MPGKIIKRSFLSLCALLLSGCAITVPNTRVCSIAGVISAGANCAWTLSEQTEEMTLDQFIEFLEPNDTRGGAICQSSDDWNKMKTALEQACKKLGPNCSYEVQQELEASARRVFSVSRARR
jgi:hypothetical protein